MENPPSLFPIVLLATVALVLLYVFFSGQGNRVSTASVDIPRETGECRAGEKISCTNNGCSGLRSCFLGKWSACVAERVCEPGTRSACSEDSCIVGYRVCNDCGTGYGECFRT